MSKPHIYVACGALRDTQGRVLIVERPAGKIAALKWEFPGGKIEAGETPRAALDRELHEEIGITVREARPLTLFTHEYAERKVTLHTFLVTGWDGEPHGRESQRLSWENPHAPQALDVLPTVQPILRALCLPEDYVFTPSGASQAQLIRGLPAFPRGSLLRLRQPQLDRAAYTALARTLIAAARPWGLRMVVGGGEALARQLGADGVHFRQAELMGLDESSLARGRNHQNLLRLASCHDADSVAHAQRIGLDAVVIGSVHATATHPGAASLGWDGFQALAEQTVLPAYAIGGLGPPHKAQGFAHYAQGVAGISAYWSRSGGG